MGTIKIGWGRREFSHEGPVSIPGQMYMRISKGIRDPLYVTALALDGGKGPESRVLFLSCDLTGIRCHDAMVKRIHEAIPEIPEDAVIMNCTHTHTSMSLFKTQEKTPDGVEIYPGEKSTEFFLDQGVAAAKEAWEGRKEGGFGYGYGYAVVAHSRRTCYFEDMSKVHPNAVAPNGTSIMYGKTNDPLFSHYEAGADHFLNCLFTFDDKDQLTGMVLNVPCPSQNSECMYYLSADYWYNVRELVKKEFGENVYVLPQCAAAGDLSPRILHYGKAQQRRFQMKFTEYPFDQSKTPLHDEDYINKTMAERQDIAERIVAGAKDVFSWAKKEIFRDVPVIHLVEKIPLKKRKITPEEAQWCRDNVEAMKKTIPSQDDPNYREAMSRFNSVKWRNERAIQRFEEQGDDPRWEQPVHIVALGDMAFATNRFELYMDYMHRIQARSPFIQTFVVQLCGSDTGTYLPTKRGEEGKGYSASIFCNQVGSEGGQQLVEETLRMLNEAKEKESE